MYNNNNSNNNSTINIRVLAQHARISARHLDEDAPTQIPNAAKSTRFLDTVSNY